MVEDIGFKYWRDKFGDDPPAPWAGGRDMSAALWLDIRGLTFFSRWAVERRKNGTLDSWLSEQTPPKSEPWSLYYKGVRTGEVPVSLPESTLERFAISLGADPYPGPPWSMVTEIPVLVRKGTLLSTFETREKWLWGSADYRDIWNQWLLGSFDDPATARKYFDVVAPPPATWHEWLDCRGVPGSSDPDLSLLGWLQEGS